MAREKPALQASYSIGWGKQPQVEETTLSKKTSIKLTVKPVGDSDPESFEWDHSREVVKLLDKLEVPYEMETVETEEVDTDKKTDPGFEKALRALAAGLTGEFGVCGTTWDGGIVLETHAEFGASRHIERRAKVEAFYASRGLAPGDWTLECRHVFSAKTCRPLTLKTETVVIDGHGEGELSGDGMHDAVAADADSGQAADDMAIEQKADGDADALPDEGHAGEESPLASPEG